MLSNDTKFEEENWLVLKLLGIESESGENRSELGQATLGLDLVCLHCNFVRTWKTWQAEVLLYFVVATHANLKRSFFYKVTSASVFTLDLVFFPKSSVLVRVFVKKHKSSVFCREQTLALLFFI